MAKRPPSIKQVADAAGVSTATVSNVFSGKKPVQPKLAEKVRKAADKLGYSVNRAASNLRSGQSKVVTVLVPDLSDPFFTSIVTEIEENAQQDGYQIIVANTKDDADIERGRVSALLSWQPDGMIVVPTSDDIPEQLIAIKDQLPIVITDRGIENTDFDTVRVDNASAGETVASHLLEFGHRRVLLVASDMRISGVRDRCNGAMARIKSAGGKVDLVEVGPVPQVGAEHLSRWLDRNQMPTAIFAVTDMTTLATLTCLAKRKAEVGTDVSVVGFDDYPWMSARRTPITAVRQPIEAIASACWSTLTRRMKGEMTAAITPEPLSCELRIRASSQPIEHVKGVRIVRGQEEPTDR
jgi:LacI family transcriptional regulator